MRRHLWCAAAFLVVAFSTLANAAWEKGGIEVSTTGWNSSVISDGDDGCIIVLPELDTAPGIYVRQVDNEGTEIWETRLTTVAPEDVRPQIVPRGSGWVVAWVESNPSLRIKLAALDSNGDLVGSIVSRTEYVADVEVLRMSTSDYGGVALAWSGSAGGRWVRLDSDFDIALESAAGSDAYVINDNTDGEIRVWSEYVGGTGWQLRAMRVNSSANAWGAPVILVNQGSSNMAEFVNVVPDGAGGAVLACLDQASSGIVVQWVDDDGTTYWNGAGSIKGKNLCSTCTGEYSPALALTNDGDGVVAWTKTQFAPTTAMDVFAQRFDVTGTLSVQWGTTGKPVNSETSSAYPSLRVVPVGASSSAVAWSWTDHTDSSVRAQLLNASGDPLWLGDGTLAEYSGATYVRPDLNAVEMAADGSDAAFVVWAVEGEYTLSTVINRLPSAETEPEPSTTLVTALNSHYWRIVVGLADLGASYAVDIEHGPIDCEGDPTYDRSDNAEAATSHNVVLIDDGNLNSDTFPYKCDNSANDRLELYGETGPNIDPTSEYFYRVRVGSGMAEWEGSVLLDTEIVSGAITADAGDFAITQLHAFEEPCALDFPYTVTENSATYEVLMEVRDDCTSGTDTCATLVQVPSRVNDPRMGRHSISMRAEEMRAANCDPEKSGLQRVEIQHVRDIPFHETRFDGFSLKFDSDSGLPVRGAVITQWWQDNSTSPPLSLEVVADDNEFAILVSVLHEDNYGSPCGSTTPTHLATIPVAVDNWYDVVVEYRFCPTDPDSGGCGRVRVVVDGDEKCDVQTKLGYPEPWTPERSSEGCITYNTGCADITVGEDDYIYFDDIRQYIRDHRFGIYRGPWDDTVEPTLEIHFDELRHGTDSLDVEIPTVQIEHVVVTPTYDSGSKTWDVVFTYDTERLGEPAEIASVVRYGHYDCENDDCTTPQSVNSPAGTSHDPELTNLSEPGKYCYRIEAAYDGKTTYIDGDFTLDASGLEIYGISAVLNTEVCRNTVSWNTDELSTDNRLYYKPKSSGSWSSKLASPSSGKTCYSAYFAQSVPMDFKVSTKINNVTYESSVFDDLNVCPPMEGAPKAEEVVTEAFVTVHPNPFNPAVTITYGVPAQEAVELVIYDAAGRRVTTLVSGSTPKGVHNVRWDGMDGKGRGVASGVYFARTQVGARVFTSKLVLLK